MAVNIGELERSDSSVSTPYTDSCEHVSSFQPRSRPSSWSCTYLIRIPAALDIWVQFRDELCQALGPRLAQTALVQEEVDAQVGLGHFGLVIDGEATDAWRGVSYQYTVAAKLGFSHSTWQYEVLQSLCAHGPRP